MINKYIFGHPFDTEAVIEDIKVSEGDLPYFKINSEGKFELELKDEDIVYGLGEQLRGINKRGWHYMRL